MPRFPKGSEEAKAWGLKMKKARDLKKSMKGGMMGGSDEEDDELSEIFSGLSIIPEKAVKPIIKKAEQKVRSVAPVPTSRATIIRRPEMEIKDIQSSVGKQKRRTPTPPMSDKKRSADGSGMPSLKMEVPGSKARRGRKPLNVMNGGFLQPGQIPPQEMEGGSLKSRLAAIRAKLQQLKDRYN